MSIDDIMSKVFLFQQKGNRIVEDIIQNLVYELRLKTEAYEKLLKEYSELKVKHPELFKESNKTDDKKSIPS